MSKATETQATETQATEVKNTPKKILVSIVSKFAETNVDLTSLLGSELAAIVADFYSGLKTSRVRGLPATERLAMVEGLIAEHYAKMPIKNGAPDTANPEFGAWSYDSMKLLERKGRIEREIKEGGAHPAPKGKAAKK